MQHPMTWEAYWHYRMIVGCTAAGIGLVGLAVQVGIQHWGDTHVDYEPMKVTKILDL